MVRRTEEWGVQVVGAPADLRPVDVPGTDPADVDPALAAETATVAVAGLGEYWVQRVAAEAAGAAEAAAEVDPEHDDE